MVTEHLDCCDDPSARYRRVMSELLATDALRRIGAARDLGERASQNARGSQDTASSPFNGYVRMLTEGGIFIRYRDQLRHPLLTFLRFVVGAAAIGACAWLFFTQTAWSSSYALLAQLCSSILIVSVVRLPIVRIHTFEIRPDALIVEGKYVFYPDDIGDNWPELHMRKDDPDILDICGVSGTRLIPFASACRLDAHDRTPEVLENDLKLAMEQLWGRREVTFEESA